MGNKGNFREDEEIVYVASPFSPSPILCLIKESNNNKKGQCQMMITSYNNCILGAFICHCHLFDPSSFWGVKSTFC